MSKKPSKKQLEARRLFAMRVKRGDFRKKTSTKKSKKFPSKNKKFIQDIGELSKSRKDLERTVNKARKFMLDIDLDKFLNAMMDPKVKSITFTK